MGWRMSKWTSCIIMPVIAVMLCACGSVADYSTQVDAFATATSKARDALADYDKVIDQEVLAQNTEVALSNRGYLRPKTGDCIKPADLGDTGRCRLVLKPQNGAETLLEPEPADSRTRQIMAGVVTYAGNLKAIAAAATSSEIDAAKDKAVANLQSFAGNLDTAFKTNGSLAKKINDYAGPISEVGGYILSKAAEHEKIAALREATGRMETVMPDVVGFFSETGKTALGEKRLHLFDNYNDARQAYVDAENDAHIKPEMLRAKLDSLRTAAAAYDAALSTDPIAVFKALADSHSKLTTALAAKNPDFSQFWPSIMRVLEEAAKIAELAEGLESIAKK